MIGSKSKKEVLLNALKYYEKTLKQRFETKQEGVTKLDLLPDIAQQWLQQEYMHIKSAKAEVKKVVSPVHLYSLIKKKQYKKSVFESALDEYSFGLSQFIKVANSPSGRRMDREIKEEEKMVMELMRKI